MINVKPLDIKGYTYIGYEVIYQYGLQRFLKRIKNSGSIIRIIEYGIDNITPYYKIEEYYPE